MSDRKKLRINPLRLIISCIICAVLGAAPMVIGNLRDWDIVLMVFIMVAVSAPLATTAFNLINRVKNEGKP